jgi:hypothetical protein
MVVMGGERDPGLGAAIATMRPRAWWLYAIVAAAAVAMVPLAALGVVRSKGPWLLSVAFVVLVALWAGRVAVSRVVFFEHGIDVRNPFSRFRLNWTQISDLGIGNYFPAMTVVIVRTAERDRPLFASMQAHPLGFGKGGNDADRLLENVSRHRPT